MEQINCYVTQLFYFDFENITISNNIIEFMRILFIMQSQNYYIFTLCQLNAFFFYQLQTIKQFCIFFHVTKWKNKIKMNLSYLSNGVMFKWHKKTHNSTIVSRPHPVHNIVAYHMAIK